MPLVMCRQPEPVGKLQYIRVKVAGAALVPERSRAIHRTRSLACSDRNVDTKRAALAMLALNVFGLGVSLALTVGLQGSLSVPLCLSLSFSLSFSLSG
jgi:hypothetical protein